MFWGFYLPSLHSVSLCGSACPWFTIPNIKSKFLLCCIKKLNQSKRNPFSWLFWKAQLEIEFLAIHCYSWTQQEMFLKGLAVLRGNLVTCRNIVNICRFITIGCPKGHQLDFPFLRKEARRNGLLSTYGRSGKNGGAPEIPSLGSSFVSFILIVNCRVHGKDLDIWPLHL